jgi:HK97 gp10 family phage protein
VKTGARIIGMNRLLKRLKVIPDAVYEAAVETITDHSRQIASEAAAFAPSEEGELASKIKARKVRRSKKGVKGTVASNAPHSIHVEYGTASQPPQPFLRPAARKAERVADMARKIWAAFKK